MPRIASRGGADELLVAIDSGCFHEPDGTEHFIMIGTRLKASHPVCRLAPDCFAPASLDAELGDARRALYESRGLGAYVG